VNELTIVKSASFGDIQCDIYQGDSELYVTREQIGRALEYADPKKAIEKIHSAHKDRFSGTPRSGGPLFSRKVQIDTPSGRQTAVLYTRKGIMEICRHSDQPKADAFMDWVWEIMDSLMTGKTKLIDMSEYQRRNIETREQNIKIRKAQLLRLLALKYPDTTYAQVLDSYATKELTGEHLLPLPSLPARTFTAEEVGQELGISKNMVGILTNRHNLKTDEYGAWFNDKAKGHSKEVQSFRYYENVIPVLEAIIKQQTA